MILGNCNWKSIGRRTWNVASIISLNQKFFCVLAFHSELSAMWSCYLSCSLYITLPYWVFNDILWWLLCVFLTCHTWSNIKCDIMSFFLKYLSRSTYECWVIQNTKLSTILLRKNSISFHFDFSVNILYDRTPLFDSLLINPFVIFLLLFLSWLMMQKQIVL